MNLSLLFGLFFLLVDVTLASFQTFQFGCNKDSGISSQFNQSYFIRTLSVKTKYQCTIECENDLNCFSASYSAVNGDCTLFNNTANSTSIQASQFNNVYTMKCKYIFNICFKNYKFLRPFLFSFLSIYIDESILTSRCVECFFYFFFLINILHQVAGFSQSCASLRCTPYTGLTCQPTNKMCQCALN